MRNVTLASVLSQISHLTNGRAETKIPVLLLQNASLLLLHRGTTTTKLSLFHSGLPETLGPHLPQLPACRTLWPTANETLLHSLRANGTLVLQHPDSNVLHLLLLAPHIESLKF